MFKQSALWVIKTIKALHDLCKTIDYAIALSWYNIYMQFRMAFMYKPATWKIIKKCFNYLQPLLKQLTLVELKVV